MKHDPERFQSDTTERGTLTQNTELLLDQTRLLIERARAAVDRSRIHREAGERFVETYRGARPKSDGSDSA